MSFLRAPRAGGAIRAKLLARLVEKNNKDTEYVRGPVDVTGGSETEGDTVQGERGPAGERGDKGDPGEGLNLNETWREASRTTSTVRIESDSDPNVFVNVKRIERIRFSRPGGGVITLVFDN